MPQMQLFYQTDKDGMYFSFFDVKRAFSTYL